MTSRMLLIIAALAGGTGVLIGAFGAHSLPNLLHDLPEQDLVRRKDWLETGVKYQMYHAAALLALALAGEKWGSLSGPAVAWLIGILIFCGCLYAMSLTGIRVLGAVVPIGGVAFIVGWGLVLLKALKSS